MSTDFEMRLAHDLQSYAGVAAGAATEAEIEAALALRPLGRGGRRPFVSFGRRSWLVAAAVVALLVLASVAVGAFLIRAWQPSVPFRLSIVATGSPEFIWEWDADRNGWTQVTNGVRYSQSPDGRWVTYGTTELKLRAIGPRARGEATIWGRVDLPGGEGQTLPSGTWSRDSRGLLAILPDGTLRVADILPRPIAVQTYPGLPEAISTYAWDRIGTDAHPRVVAIGQSGAVYVLDTALGEPTSVANVPTWPPDPDGAAYPVLALSEDGNRAAVIDRAGGAYVVDLIGGTSTAVAVDPTLADQPLWGWSPDGSWIGVGDRMIDLVTGEQVRLSGAAAPGCSSMPAWGPSGHAVAWLGDGFLRTRDDGGNLVDHPLDCASGATTTGTSVAWRPDGRAIAVVLQAMGAENVPVGGSIQVFDLSSNRLTEVATDHRPFMHYTIHWIPVP